MHLARVFRFVAPLGFALVACGGAVAPDPFGASSSGGTSSGGSSSGGSSSGGSSSGGSSSGSVTCVEGSLGAQTCPACDGTYTRQACVGGKWSCPLYKCPAPPPCGGGTPPACDCPSNCSCGAACDPKTNQWTCTSTCSACAGAQPECFCGVPACVSGQWECPRECADAGLPFACGNQDCAHGTICQDTPSDVVGQPDTYRCVPVPDACVNDYSCACVVGAPGASSVCPAASCDSTFGNIVVHCKAG